MSNIVTHARTVLLNPSPRQASPLHSRLRDRRWVNRRTQQIRLRQVRPFHNCPQQNCLF